MYTDRQYDIYVVDSFTNYVTPRFLVYLVISSNILRCLFQSIHVIVLKIHHCSSRKTNAILDAPADSLILVKDEVSVEVIQAFKCKEEQEKLNRRLKLMVIEQLSILTQQLCLLSRERRNFTEHGTKSISVQNCIRGSQNFLYFGFKIKVDIWSKEE